MEQKRCKNKKCQRILPEGYKHKYCENCRNEYAKQIKEGWKLNKKYDNIRLVQLKSMG